MYLFSCFLSETTDFFIDFDWSRKKLLSKNAAKGGYTTKFIKNSFFRRKILHATCSKIDSDLFCCTLRAIFFGAFCCIARKIFMAP